MGSQLFTDAVVLAGDGSPSGVGEIFVVDDQIAWVGGPSDGAPRAERRTSLHGAVVSPGFVDAHVHMTATGLMLGGLNLHGTRDAADLRRRLATFVKARTDRFVWGYGWEDTTWPEPPGASMLASVAGDRYLYLSRIDGHSALVSRVLFDAAGCASEAGCDIGPDGNPTGIVRRDAHHAARLFFLSRLPTPQIRAAHKRAADAAVAAGITTVHEMGGPLHGAGERDLDLLLESRLPVEVVCYYASDNISIAKSRGLKQIGGDYNADGALGSRTAALHRPYADARPHRGHLYQDSDALAEFFERATRAGLQAGVHCIGDAGCDAAVKGLERAARRVGTAKLRSMRHRLEHFEMAPRDLIRLAARLGAVFSVQPSFDAAWGGPRGMYATRVGPRRAAGMNDYKTMVIADGVVGFGSDSPVTQMDPVGAMRAAIKPTNRAHALTAGQAFRAATTGAAALAHHETRLGRVASGYQADFVVWNKHPLEAGAEVQATISRGRVVYGELPKGPAGKPRRRRSSTPARSRA